MKIKINDQEAQEMADAILSSEFFMAGYGHFDLKPNQVKEILKTTINNNGEERIKKLRNLYEKYYQEAIG